MKTRTDFVTNSSSASYVIEFRLKSKKGATATFKIRTGDIGTSCTVSDTPGEFESERHAKELELGVPREENGDILLGRYPLSSTTDLEELITGMLSLVDARLYGGNWVGTPSIMPDAAEALARSCEKQGITRDNLRIIGGKIWVKPWGDSLYEVSEYIDQWGINVRKMSLKHTGRIYWRGRGTPNWHPDWRDTMWWPWPFH